MFQTIARQDFAPLFTVAFFTLLMTLGVAFASMQLPDHTSSYETYLASVAR